MSLKRENIDIKIRHLSDDLIRELESLDVAGNKRLKKYKLDYTIPEFNQKLTEKVSIFLEDNIYSPNRNLLDFSELGIEFDINNLKLCLWSELILHIKFDDMSYIDKLFSKGIVIYDETLKQFLNDTRMSNEYKINNLSNLFTVLLEFNLNIILI